MKTIIAGSRGLSREATLRAIATCPWTITEVVSGCASGPDTHGEEWAAAKGIPVHRMPADWKGRGRGAGLARNVEMARVAEALVATWDSASRGTKHMIETARRLGLKVHVHEVKPMTQIEQVVALFDAMPGDVATYVRIAKELEVLKRHTDPAYRGPERDGTVDERQWGHIRNVARAMRDLAFALKSIEDNDDPDIPF